MTVSAYPAVTLLGMPSALSRSMAHALLQAWEQQKQQRLSPAPELAPWQCLAPLPEEAVQTRTDFGQTGYGGAAPPKGESHRYIFTVHALDVDKIEVDEGASGAMVGFNVHFHSLGSASITALFS